MKTNLLFLIVLFFLLAGCSTQVSKVEWDIGRVYNSQFAEKVIIVDKFEFEAKYREGVKTDLIKGDISDCIVKSLRNTLVGYAVLKEQDRSTISPQAKIIKITPTKVNLGRNFWGTKHVGEISVKMQIDNTVNEIEGEGKGPLYMYKIAITEACDNLASKIEEKLTK
ncbi:MAG: hypothetical protein QMD43_06585 [Thermodesulfovibrio sp.]|uniref:hypothetical protein n=1 Tax=Thermodesulfovibrio sp. N1 TaxID=1871110 RepID=UPI00083B9996|nr:hypothetical protein [Thermodesulfovibrio sp. N1]MDI6714674.1 hypothetical protein [Thermodesulfovibrio sp.]ODA44123.1 hypothetical protein THER_1149 [Thermodesulfovibrio sp. N1]